jgi:outer membrane protein OmpA-like peptidoglycan-associated protein
MKKRLSFSLFLFIVFFLTQQSHAQAGLIGEYFDGENFNTKIMTRTDTKIDFNWGLDAPQRGMDAQHFSIRWHGRLTAPVSGEYEFQAKVDDGIRLWLDDKRVIDAWGLNDAVQFKGKMYLNAGQSYDLKVEYYNGMLNSLVQVRWKRPDKKSMFDALWDNTEVIPSNVFSVPEPTKTIAVAPPAPPKQEIKKPKPITPKPVVKKPNPVVVAAPPPSAAAKKQAEESAMIEKIKQELEPQFIYFVQSTNEILPTSQKSLDEWVQYLNQMPSKSLQIQGYTDALGDQKMNFTLSEQRAKAVALYLTQHGIAESRLTSKGLGGSQPIFKNPKTEKERALNRRVEIKIL